MSKMIKIAGIAAIAIAIVQPLQAIPISGSIDMSGTATLNNVNLGSATAATSITAATVGGVPTGSYAGTAGAAVTWTGFSWPGGSASTLWSFTVGAWTYSFSLINDTVSSQSNSFLNLLGTGTLFITGAGSPYDVTGTSGNWSFTISNPGGGSHQNFAFTFANSQNTVPDGASTAMLLGLALSGVTLLKRKFTA